MEDEMVLKSPKGATKRRKRVGRGRSSGSGKTSGRGHGGQNSRSGGGVRPGFEGGQMPLFRRIARRGFSNARFKRIYALINLSDLEKMFADGAEVNRETLMAAGLIKRRDNLIKLLSKGELTKTFKVQVNKISASAKEKIKKLNGEVIELDANLETENENKE